MAPGFRLAAHFFYESENIQMGTDQFLVSLLTPAKGVWESLVDTKRPVCPISRMPVIFSYGDTIKEQRPRNARVNLKDFGGNDYVPDSFPFPSPRR